MSGAVPVPGLWSALRAGPGTRGGKAGRWLLAAFTFVISVEIALGLVPRYLAWRVRLENVDTETLSGRVVVVGDSVSAGFGVAPGRAWPVQMVKSLQARGVEWIGLDNRASPATTTTSAASEISQEPLAGSVLLVMLGHNDFVVWRDIVNQRQVVDRDWVPSALVPYLPRLFRLGWYAAVRSVASGVLDDDTVAQFGRQMGQVLSAARGVGATPVLLTYPVPGEATDDVYPDGGPQAARVVRATQLAANQVVRELAVESGALLFDVERAVPASSSWQPREFLDVIHPTDTTHARVGQAVATQLIAAGLLTP